VHAQRLIESEHLLTLVARRPDPDRLDPAQLPIELAVTTITMAELAAGPHAATGLVERARRQDRLQRAEATFDPLPFDSGVAYGLVYAATLARGRKARGPRAVDLMIAAVACATGLPLYTREAGAFRPLGDLVDVVTL
jgi:predicted nucleic acid-binding protein